MVLCEWIDCTEDVDDLQDHLKKHIPGNGDYKCLWKNCFRFNIPQTNKYTFAAHLKCHSGIKPFICKLCEKHFARSDALNKHIKKHELEETDKRESFDKIFYASERRDWEINQTSELLEERQHYNNLLRIIQEEKCRRYDTSNYLEDSWEDYL